MILLFQPDCETRMSIKNQHGIALMTVILFVFILSLTWISYSFINSYESGVVQNQIDSEKAFYAAEAGIQQALYFLSQDWDWQHWSQHGYIPVPGGKLTQGSPTYYQWSGNLGDNNQTYTVQIRNDGKIQSKIRVGSPNLDLSEAHYRSGIGSAFDFGLYSYDQTDKMDFRGSFTVSGDKQTGYVYAKQEIINPANLHADKITGNYQNAPAPYYFFPKEIPPPHPAVFRATIYGAPTSTSIQYTNETGEESLGLAPGNQLCNTTKGGVRTIQSVDKSTNTIVTSASTVPWTRGDEIIDDYCQAFAQTLLSLLPSPSPELYNSPIDAGENLSVDSGSPPSFPKTSEKIADFQAPNSVNFSGDTTFLEKTTTRIHGNATFSGNTIIDGDMVVDGGAIFSNQVTVNGRLYVTGSLLTTQNLTTETGGEVVVSGAININQVAGSGSDHPLFIVTTLGNLTITTLGPLFYGLVYAGGNISSINSINIGGGNIIANNFSSSALNRGSIINKDWKSNLSALGFSDSKDFVRPILWSEPTQ